MSAQPQPPRVSRRLLAAWLGTGLVGRSILGDLDEEFDERARTNARAARRWYRREAAAVWWRAPRPDRLHSTTGDPLMRIILTDLLRAVRSLVKQPRFTAVAALTLALGVGATTAIFSVVNGVLLKPLPYPEADRLVNVWSHAPKLGYNQFPLSPDIFFLFERENTLFESMTLFLQRRANLTGDGTPDVVQLASTTHTYFSTLGVTLAEGRAYTEADDRPDAPPVVVLSHRAWRDRFGGERGVLGRTIQLDGQATQIIGVAPAAIDGVGSPDLFVPGRMNREQPIAGSFSWRVSARLKPGVPMESAAAPLTGLVPRLLETITSPTYRAFLVDGEYSVLVNSMKEDLVGSLERPLWILLGTVGLLLLVACANVANLFLVRAEARQLDIAVRVSLGASRVALVRGLMVEALVLGVVGSSLGVVASGLGLPLLLRQAPATIPRLDQVTLDPSVLLFAAGTSVFAAVMFGLLPALRYTRPHAMATLRHGGRGGTEEPARRRARQGLVVIQTAMAVVLLVGSGLLARSFSKLIGTNPGFDAHGVMTFRVALPAPPDGDGTAVVVFANQLVERLGGLSGVESAAAVTSLPIASSSNGTAHEFEGRPVAAGAVPPLVHFKGIVGGYFDTMGIPLHAGRDFHSGDFTPDARTVIANQALADFYWPDQDPLGKRVRTTSPDPANPQPWYTVVGVVGTVYDEGLRRPVRPLFYYPAVGGANAPTDSTALSYVVRGRGLDARGGELRQAVWGLNPGLPVAELRTMESIVSNSIVQLTFTMSTLGIAAVMALLLGAVGLYGVLSYAVTLRTREIGVRLALGATPSVVMRSVVLNGTILAAIGLAIGLAGAAGLTRLMGDMLFETEPLDPATFTIMSVTLLIVAAIASFLPARRAARVSPLESMKAD